jgi:hypothetical protein
MHTHAQLQSLHWLKKGLQYKYSNVGVCYSSDVDVLAGPALLIMQHDLHVCAQQYCAELLAVAWHTGTLRVMPSALLLLIECLI